MKVFLSLCLLFSLVSPEELETCRVCLNEEGTECMENDTEYCFHPTCISAIVNGNLIPRVPRAYYSCGFCEAGHYAFNTGSSGFFDMVVECCGSNNCNAKPLKIPSKPMKPNGLECSGCYAEDQEECRGNEVVRCLGDQTRCIKMRIDFVRKFYIYRKIYSARGCATREMCEKKFEYILTFYPHSATIKCGDAV